MYTNESITKLLRSTNDISVLTGIARWQWSLLAPLVAIKTHPWWRHQMETFSALLAICARNSPVSDEFPAKRPVTRSFDVFFDLRLDKRSSKHSWGGWFETLLCPLWRHRNEQWNVWYEYQNVSKVFNVYTRVNVNQTVKWWWKVAGSTELSVAARSPFKIDRSDQCSVRA